MTVPNEPIHSGTVMAPTWGELGGRLWRVVRTLLRPPSMCDKCGDAMLRHTRGTKRCVSCNHITGRDLADIVAASGRRVQIVASATIILSGIGVAVSHVVSSASDLEYPRDVLGNVNRSAAFYNHLADSINHVADSIGREADSLCAVNDSIEASLRAGH